MPKIPTPLTDTKIKKSRLKDKNYSLSDGKGLHLLIKTNGIKQWEFVYTSPTKHKRRKTSFEVTQMLHCTRQDKNAQSTEVS